MAIKTLAASDARIARVLRSDPSPRRSGPRLHGADALGEAERRLLDVGRSQYVPWMMSLALNEVVVLIGLVLAVLSGRFGVILPFAGIGAFVAVMLFPRWGVLRDRAERALAELDPGSA